MVHPDNQTTEDLLRESIRLGRDNNRLLKKLWRAQVTTFWARLLLIAVFIGVPVYIYRVYFNDYVIQMQDAYQQLRENFSTLPKPPAQ